MSLTQRIQSILSALLSLLGAVLLIRMKEDGIYLISFLLSISFLLYGLRALIYYFTMARHMGDGKGILFRGIILLDFGIFTLSITQRAWLFVACYLLGVYAVSGVIDFLRAMEAKQMESPMWRLTMAEGIVRIIIAVAAIVFGFALRNLRDLTWIYASGLFYSAVLKIISAFRKTAVIYIP